MPQLERFHRSEDIHGISLFYIFWSSVTATQNLIIAIGLTKVDPNVTDVLQYLVVGLGQFA